MPLPVTRGRPRDWQVGKQSPASADQLQSRSARNEQEPCRCPGCTRHRAAVSRYCTTHRDAASRRGDPVARLPTANELTIFKHAVKVYLDANPKTSSRVNLGLGYLDGRMMPPSTFQLGYADLHRKLPQVAKAKGLLANWYHRRGKTYSDAILHAVALMGWTAVYYDGLPENRRSFLETCAGALLGNIRLPRKDRPSLCRETSGAVKRHLGSDFLRHAHEVYGKAFWDSAVATQDGQEMTLLSYTKQALRAAQLL